MARYVQDYLYSELPEDLISDAIEWVEYDSLPIASQDYYMTMAVIRESKSTKCYICREIKGKFVWTKIFDSDYPDIPTTDGTYLFNVKDGVASFVEPEKYPSYYPTSEGEYIMTIDSEGEVDYISLKMPKKAGRYVLVVDTEGKLSWQEETI